MRKLPLIDRLRVGTACDVGWDNMADLGRDRHCARCDLVVHDVSAMTRAEVEALLDERARGQRMCLHRVVRESDGAVLVADGYIAGRRRAPPSRMVAAAVATATATAMTACSPAPPPQAPQAEIAVAPMSAPAPIETASPATEPPPAMPAETTPAEPEPFSEPVTPVKITPLKVAPPAPVKPSKTPPAKTVPPRHIEMDGDVGW